MRFAKTEHRSTQDLLIQKEAKWPKVFWLVAVLLFAIVFEGAFRKWLLPADLHPFAYAAKDIIALAFINFQSNGKGIPSPGSPLRLRLSCLRLVIFPFSNRWLPVAFSSCDCTEKFCFVAALWTSLGAKAQF